MPDEWDQYTKPPQHIDPKDVQTLFAALANPGVPVECVCVRGQLGDYKDNLLDLTQKLAVAAHLSACPACTARLAELKAGNTPV